MTVWYGHLLDLEEISDLLATIRIAASQWRDIGCHLGFEHKELNNMAPKNNTPVDYLEEMLEQWLNWAPPLRSFAYTEDLVEALRAANLEKLAHTLENDERFMKKENYKQIERTTPSTGTSKSGEYSKSYSSIPHHSDRKSADSGPVNKKQTEGVPDDNSDRTDLHDSHSGIRMDSSLAHGAATREHTDGNGSGSTAAQWTKIPDGNRPKAVPQQTYRENPEEKKSKDGYVKHKRGNLTSEHSNSNEQVQGVRQQIDSHPPPLPPVEEEMHTKPSQHAHVHTEEDLEMPLVLWMDQVPRPLDSDDNLLDQEAMVAVNVAVGGEQASMDEAMIEGVQGQDQMVEQCGDVMVVGAGTSPSHLVMSKGQEEGRDTFSSERSGGDTAQSEVSDNAVPKGVLGRPAHETKCDVGGSHGGKTNSEKAPNRTDAVAAFQKSQDEKPNNKMDTTLSPGASKGKEVIRDAFSSERSGGNTSQSEVIDNVKRSREGILEGPSHETKCDDGGSHVGTSKPKKTPNCSDAMDLFQQSQEEKPSNKMKGTVLPPGTQGEEPVVAEPHNIEKCSTGTSPQSAQGKNPKKGNGRVKIDGQEDEVTFKSGSEEGGAVASSKNPANKIENGTQSSTVSNGASKSGECSKSDSSIPDALHSNRKSADNGPENKKQTEVVHNQDSNGTDLHDNHSQMEEEHSPSVSSAGVSEESVVANGADTHEHTDGKRSNTFPQQTHKENPGKKKSKGTSTSKGCSKPPDQSVHSSDGTAAQNGSDNKKQPNFTQIQVNNIQITHPTVSQPERREVPAPDDLQQDITNEGITDSAIDQVAAEVPKENVAEIFRKVYATLIETLEADDITPALFSTGLISTVERNGIAVQGQTSQHKTTKLLEAVQRAIDTEPNNFYTFIKLLNKHRKYTPLVMNIMERVADATSASGSPTTTTSSTQGPSGSSTTTTSSTQGPSGSSTTTTSSTQGPSGSSTTTTSSTPGPATTPGSSQNKVENDGATDPTSNAHTAGLPPDENGETRNQISSQITVISSFISSCPVWLKTSLKMAVLLGILYIGILKLYRFSLRWKKPASFLLHH